MFNFNWTEWSPVVGHIVVILVILSLIVYMALLCLGEQWKLSNQRYNRLVSRWMAFYFGVALALLLNFIKDHGHLGQYPTDLYWANQNALLRPVRTIPALDATFNHGHRGSSAVNALLDNPEKVIFITTTEYSLVQPAVLTKIGQALYPVRAFVIWIVVSTMEPFGPLDCQGKKDLKDLLGNDTEQVAYGKIVEKTLKRFGVPYVLLESHSYLSNQFVAFSPYVSEETRIKRGLQTGLIWALKHFKRGVVMLGHEQFTYNYRIFEEVRMTKVASSWPVGLGRRYGFSSPILDKGSQKIKGYHDGFGISLDQVHMDRGAFAVNIEHLRTVDPNVVWKMTLDGSYTMGDLGIKLNDIEPLGENATKILVWRTKTRQHPWPKQIFMKEYYKKSNLIQLMKNVFGLRYPYIKKNYNFVEKKDYKVWY